MDVRFENPTDMTSLRCNIDSLRRMPTMNASLEVGENGDLVVKRSPFRSWYENSAEESDSEAAVEQILAYDQAESIARSVCQLNLGMPKLSPQLESRLDQITDLARARLDNLRSPMPYLFRSQEEQECHETGQKFTKAILKAQDLRKKHLPAGNLDLSKHPIFLNK